MPRGGRALHPRRSSCGPTIWRRGSGWGGASGLTGRLQEAAAQFEEAIRIDSGVRPRPWMVRALILLQLGALPARRRDWLREALLVHPGHPDSDGASGAGRAGLISARARGCRPWPAPAPERSLSRCRPARPPGPAGSAGSLLPCRRGPAARSRCCSVRRSGRGRSARPIGSGRAPRRGRRSRPAGPRGCCVPAGSRDAA